jgi:predicted transcriptional regulator
MEALDFTYFKRAEEILNFCNNETRRSILIHIFENPEITVKELSEQLNIDQPWVSTSLTKLRTAGVIDFKRTGTKKHYYAKDAVINEFSRICGLIVQKSGG